MSSSIDPPRESLGGLGRRILLALLAAAVVLGVYVWAASRFTLRVPQLSGTSTLEPVLVINGPGVGPAPRLSRPLAAAWGPGDLIYVADTGNSRVCVFDQYGRFESEMAGPGSEDTTGAVGPALVQPAGLAVDEGGDIFVADVQAGAVFVFDSAGTFVRTIAPPLSARSLGWHPTDVARVSGLLYVTDAEGVAVFIYDGTWVGRLGQAHDPVVLMRPNGIAVCPDGSLVVSDTNAQRVVSYTPEGEVLWTVGPGSGSDRQFGLPRGLVCDEDGMTYVADAFKFGIAAVTPNGLLADVFYVRGSAPGQFEYPNDIDIRGDYWLIADKENDRVQVLKYTPARPR